MTFSNSVNQGHLLENMVFMHLRRNGFDVEYVSTANGYETDFFARHPITGKVSLLQVCWDMSNEKTFTRELKGLKDAMVEFGVDTGTIVTWDEESKLDNGINIVPVWKWLLG